MYSITKEFKFEYAHRLYDLLNTPSLCQYIHGHSARILVQIDVEDYDLGDDGMVVDFTKLKELQNQLDEKFDHSIILNSNDPLCNVLKEHTKRIAIFKDKDATAENLAFEIYKLLSEVINGIKIINCEMTDFLINIVKYIKVTVYETPKNCASYSKSF